MDDIIQLKKCPEQLFNEHYAWALNVGFKIWRNLNSKLLMREEIISVILIGFWQACQRHDETNNARFKSFAFHRIRGSIMDEVRSKRRIRYKKERIENASYRLNGQEIYFVSQKSEIEDFDFQSDMDVLLKSTRFNNMELALLKLALNGVSITADVLHSFGIKINGPNLAKARESLAAKMGWTRDLAVMQRYRKREITGEDVRIPRKCEILTSFPKKF